MCVFSARKKKKLKKQIVHGSFHPTSVQPTSVHHHYLQQYQAWFYVPIFFLIYSRLIRQIFGEFICNDKKSILEFSIQRKTIWKKKKHNERNHHVAWFAFSQRKLIYRHCICFRTVHLDFFDFVIVVVVILLFIVYVVFQFY